MIMSSIRVAMLAMLMPMLMPMMMVIMSMRAVIL